MWVRVLSQPPLGASGQRLPLWGASVSSSVRSGAENIKSVILKGRERGRDTERDSPRNMMLKSNASYLHLLKVTLFIQG